MKRSEKEMCSLCQSLIALKEVLLLASRPAAKASELVTCLGGSGLGGRPEVGFFSTHRDAS